MKLDPAVLVELLGRLPLLLGRRLLRRIVDLLALDRHQHSFWPEADLRGFLDAFEVFAGSAPPTLRRSASIRSTTLTPAGRSFFAIGWPARFLLMRSTSAASYWSSNFAGSNLPAFWLTMCLARSSMSLVTLTSWISSKYSFSARTS